MPSLALHHVAVIIRDLAISLPFYRDAFGLVELDRPPFAIGGAWLGCGAQQVHLVVHPEGTFRTRGIDRNDTHFAFRTHDFEAAVERLAAMGYREDASDPARRVEIYRTGIAGFPQLYMCDPDRNVVEINGAPP